VNSRLKEKIVREEGEKRMYERHRQQKPRTEEVTDGDWDKDGPA